MLIEVSLTIIGLEAKINNVEKSIQEEAFCTLDLEMNKKQSAISIPATVAWLR